MRTRDSNYLNMALAVKKIMQAHATEITGRTMLEAKVKQMNKTIASIQTHHSYAETNSKGVTASKYETAAAAVDLAILLAGFAVEYAKDQKDTIKKARFNVSLSDFERMEGVVVVARLKDLVKHLKEEAAALEAYDVTQAEIDELETLTVSLNTQLADPRELIVIRKSHNEKVHAELSNLKAIMESMDNLMGKFKGTSFMNEYEGARMVIPLGTRKTKNINEAETDKGADSEVA